MAGGKWVLGRPVVDGKGPRLICLHHAGGGASSFHLLRKLLGPAVEVLAVQLPGRETRLGEPLQTDAQALVEQLCAHLHPYLSRPYAVFGHSMGGLLAYLLASRLEQDPARVPVRLFVSAAVPPRGTNYDARAKDPKSDAELLRGIIDLDGMSKELLSDRDYVSSLLQVVRADMSLVESALAGARLKLQTPLSLLLGESDRSVSPESKASWSQLSVSFETRTFPGGHFFTRSAAAQIAAFIKDRLA